MHLVFQEITIVVSLILSSYLLALTSPDFFFSSCYRWDKLWCQAACACFGFSCVEQENKLSYKWGI